jgi:hypothetical protein
MKLALRLTKVKIYRLPCNKGRHYSLPTKPNRYAIQNFIVGHVQDTDGEADATP